MTSSVITGKKRIKDHKKKTFINTFFRLSEPEESVNKQVSSDPCQVFLDDIFLTDYTIF